MRSQWHGKNDYNYNDELDTNIVINNTEYTVIFSAKAVVNVTSSKKFFDDAIGMDTDKNQLISHKHAQSSPRKTPPLPKNYNFSKILHTPTVWVLAYTFTIVTGKGTLITNNIVEMVESFNLPTETASISLAFFSAVQATSCCIMGTLLEYVLEYHQLGQE